MKSKSFNAILVLTSLIGYLEWGKDNHSFLFQAEAEIISRLFIDPLSVIHPFTFLPLIGQVLLLITLLQRQPNRLISFIGMIGIRDFTAIDVCDWFDEYEYLYSIFHYSIFSCFLSDGSISCNREQRS